MLVIKDAMVVIHLAKITLLEKSCEYFQNVVIPQRVEEEIFIGDHPDALIVKEMIRTNKLMVKQVHDKQLLRKAYACSIFGGEAEAVALYWQEGADLIATDDDNVRRRNIVLNLKMFGTPAIIVTLYKTGIITKDKSLKSIQQLKEIGWFSTSIIDKLIMEVQQHG